MKILRPWAFTPTTSMAGSRQIRNRPNPATLPTWLFINAVRKEEDNLAVSTREKTARQLGSEQPDREDHAFDGCQSVLPIKIRGR